MSTTFGKIMTIIVVKGALYEKKNGVLFTGRREGKIF